MTAGLVGDEFARRARRPGAATARLRRRAVAHGRLAWVALHLAWGFAASALLLPLLADEQRRALRRRWSAALLRILAVRLRAEASEIAPGSLIVANHISWLDVFVINAICPAAFVAKDEVAQWPGLAWLLARNETLLLRRGSARAARRTGAEIADLLAVGRRVAVFPEGTTTDGSRVLPFHGGLLQAAIDKGAAVYPIALSYHDEAGRRCTAAVYVGDTTLWHSLRAIAVARVIDARVKVLAPVNASACTRRELAARLHAPIELACAAAHAAPGDSR
jgi:1-acyl-sn-glycerol-3-phosphate acyltransferase